MCLVSSALTTSAEKRCETSMATVPKNASPVGSATPSANALTHKCASPRTRLAVGPTTTPRTRTCPMYHTKIIDMARRKSVAEGRSQCHRCSRHVYSRQCGRAAVHTVLEGSLYCGERRAKVAPRLTTLPLQRTTSSPTSWFGELLLNTVRRSGARTYSPTPKRLWGVGVFLLNFPPLLSLASCRRYLLPALSFEGPPRPLIQVRLPFLTAGEESPHHSPLERILEVLFLWSEEGVTSSQSSD